MSESNSAETGKSMDRESGIVHKRRSDFKSNFKSATDDEDGDSAPSLKASSNPPLPELQRDKRKLIIKPFNSLQTRAGPAFVEKEVRQHENILLKQRNNLLVSQNLKLKTRITVLEKQNQRLQKSTENEAGQAKPSTSYGASRERLKPNDATLRAVIRGLRREIEDLKKQNLNIKSAVKFTSLKQLQAERDHLAEETIRLRLALEEEQTRRTFLKTNVQGVSTLEHKVQHLSEKNAQLMRELNQAVEKSKKMEEGAVKAQRAIDNDRKNAKALQSAILQIREKDNQIEQLKSQLKTSNSIPSVTLLQQQTPKENKFDIKRPSIERKPKPTIPQVKPVAQKAPAVGGCQKCNKLQAENKMLLDKIKKMEIQIDKNKGSSYGQLPRGPIAQVREEQVHELKRFLTLRFKAHRLSYEQSEKYLINCEGLMKEAELAKPISVRELMESLFVQPFCIVSNRYLQVLISRLAFPGVQGAVNIDDNAEVKKGSVVEAYRKLLPRYEVMSQEKEEEMFIQVAELITTYYQQILAALTAKRNGEGTIAEKAFLQFFAQIQLEQDYTDFIITQIILESLDMEHLNFFAMFEIFYMPQMASNPNNPNTQKKKKFQVQQIVHEEDEEYEESKSHIGSRNKTLEHRQKDEGQADYQWSEDKGNVENQAKTFEKERGNDKVEVNPSAQKVEQQYGQQFQQERQQ